MVLPRWLVFTLAALVIVFGGYRLWVAFRREKGKSDKPHWSQVSVFGRSKRAHLIYGLLYVIAGGMLVATGFGWRMPFTEGCQGMMNRSEPTPADPRKTLDLEPAPAPGKIDKAE